jgi:DNA-binding XRE family transcriptional regulator
MESSLGKTNQEIASDLGKQIKNARLQLNRTQADVALQANISRRAVQALEAGDGSSLETFIAVCRCIGKTDWIYAFAPTATVNPMLVLQLKTRAEKMIRKRAVKRSAL